MMKTPKQCYTSTCDRSPHLLKEEWVTLHEEVESLEMKFTIKQISLLASAGLTAEQIKVALNKKGVSLSVVRYIMTYRDMVKNNLVL